MCLRVTEVRTGPVVAPPPAGSFGKRGPTHDGGTLGISTSTTVWVHICVCVRFKLAHGRVIPLVIGYKFYLSLLTRHLHVGRPLRQLQSTGRHWRYDVPNVR